ncbi:MAG: NAD-dependent epimerase/dehydratase family protein [Polyangiales bacterium]
MTLQLRTKLAGKALLTGTSGFIGGHLRDALLASGTEVVALVRRSSPASDKARTVVVDYEDEKAVRDVIARERPDWVFHVAGSTKGVTYDDFRRGNVLPTENLVAGLLAEHPSVKRFVLVSSLAAYGPSNDGPPRRESDARAPVEYYGRSKLEAERVVEQLGDQLAWTIVRPAAVYGPAEVDMFTLFKAAKAGINLFYGNRDKRFSAVYVDDLLQAIVDAAHSGQTRGRGYFICDGEAYTWGQAQGYIVKAVGRRALPVSLPAFLVPIAGFAGELLTAVDKKPRLLNRQKARMDAQQAWLCSSEAAARDFDFRPHVRMEEGTRRAYDWYVAHGWL